VEVVASLSQGRTAAAQCGLFTHKSVPVIFEPPCTFKLSLRDNLINNALIISSVGPNWKFKCSFILHMQYSQ